jgi:hypothetical protein
MRKNVKYQYTCVLVLKYKLYHDSIYTKPPEHKWHKQTLHLEILGFAYAPVSGIPRTPLPGEQRGIRPRPCSNSR